MNNFLRILLATIIMPAYLIADEADEPTSPAKPDEVEAVSYTHLTLPTTR